MKFLLFDGNKAKERISKQMFQEKQSMPNFLKNEHFLPPDTHTYVCLSGGKECSFFGKFGELCFSSNTRFEIRPFPFFPTFCLRHYRPTAIFGNWKPFKNDLMKNGLIRNIRLFSKFMTSQPG